MNAVNLITLATDFGLQDPFVGQLKGAILRRNIRARIIDLTHGIPAHDIPAAAMTIRTSYHYFPQGTVHLCVVDPGVGSLRTIIAMEADSHLFIAPDNGTLTLVMRDAKVRAIHRLADPSLFPDAVSATFHGRDIMAPVAAALASGMPLEQVGPRITADECVQLDMPGTVCDKDTIIGRVIAMDRFGNIRTTITPADLNRYQPARFTGIFIGSHKIESISATYSDADQGKLLALIDSSGYMEIAVNRGNAAELIGCRAGDPVTAVFDHE